MTAEDAAALFELRRQALHDSPFAFSASPEDDVWSSVDAVRARLQPSTDAIVFGAIEDRLAGMVGMTRFARVKERHKAYIWSVFVRPEYRGRGIAFQLLQAAIAHARTMPGVDVLQLSVNETTPAAQSVYEKCGFVVWGVEPDGLRHAGRSTSERHMSLDLRGG